MSFTQNLTSQHDKSSMNIRYKNIDLTVILAMTGLLLVARTQAQEPGESHLGAYGKTSTYCGVKAVPRNQPTIPQVGCFYLSAGHRATGTLATHFIEISVDDAGTEIFKVDGQRITETHDTATWTNLPYVTVGGVAGYSICERPTDRNSGCPSSITIFSRDPDKAVLFLVSECLPPQYRLCVTTQANWDYEKSRLH
jgi:hypothetical protein